MKPVITVRPARGAAATVSSGAQAGLAVHAFPLSTLGPVAWEPLPAEAVDGLLLGSANAVRHAGEGLALYREKPAYVVGPQTAEAARAAGFRVEMVGEGGLQQVLDAMPGQPLRLLRLAARRHVELVLPAGVAVDTRIAYEAEDLPMPASLADLLRAPAVVLLHSAGTAAHFAAECDRLGIARGQVALAALGPRIAVAAGAGWAAVRHAQTPRETALLALAHDLCQ